MSERAKLPRYAGNQGISYDGAYKMWRGGMLEGIQLPTGTILASGVEERKQQHPRFQSGRANQRPIAG